MTEKKTWRTVSGTDCANCGGALAAVVIRQLSRQLDVLQAESAALIAEVERLRLVNKRLNRRAQSAEATADTKAEDWNKRAAGYKLRNHYYVRAVEAEKRAEAAERERDTLRQQVEQLVEDVRALNGMDVERDKAIRERDTLRAAVRAFMVARDSGRAYKQELDTLRSLVSDPEQE